MNNDPLFVGTNQGTTNHFPLLKVRNPTKHPTWLVFPHPLPEKKKNNCCFLAFCVLALGFLVLSSLSLRTKKKKKNTAACCAKELLARLEKLRRRLLDRVGSSSELQEHRRRSTDSGENEAMDSALGVLGLAGSLWLRPWGGPCRGVSKGTCKSPSQFKPLMGCPRQSAARREQPRSNDSKPKQELEKGHK